MASKNLTFTLNIQIFRAFKWSRISILVRGFSICLYGGTNIYEAVMEAEDMTVVEFRKIFGLSDAALLRYLRNFRERSRGIVEFRTVSFFCVVSPF